MSQQMKNGSMHKGSVTITVRDSQRYAVVNEPFCGKHKKPQDAKSKVRRKLHWIERNKREADNA